MRALVVTAAAALHGVNYGNRFIVEDWLSTQPCALGRQRALMEASVSKTANLGHFPARNDKRHSN